MIPAVGDTGCDVLAKLGRPDDTRTISTTEGTTVHFIYNTGTTRERNLDSHLVELGESAGGDEIVVTSVVW